MDRSAVSSAFPLQATFNKGELSPLLGSRADIDFWRQSLAECRNFQVLTHGGLRRRSGSKFIAEVRDSSEAARLFPFKFSETQSYVLVLNDGRIRFCALRGVLGAPYEITHSWAAADLSRLSYTQFNDVAYFAHKDYQQQKLTRSGDTNWAIEDFVAKDGPYLDVNTTGTTLTPASHGRTIPIMTNNTTPSGEVVSSDASADAYRAVDGSKNLSFTLGSANNGWISYEIASSGTKVADAYWLSADDNSANIDQMIIAWTVEGSNDGGSTWTVLDTQEGETGWVAGETRFYQFKNTTAYNMYRLNWNGTNGSGAASRIGEWGLNEAGDSMTPFNLTASSTTGINDDQGFLASDEGRMIRLLGGDGKWRWARIVSRTSSTVVTIRLYGHALPDLNPIANWAMGAWSDESGWPAAVALYDERLMWARSDSEPVTVWGSKQGVFDDYGRSDPLVGTDGIRITLLSSNMNEILWIADDEDIITGSAGQIRSVGPSDITQSFSATNITQRKGPTSGAEYIAPLSIGGVVLYLAAGGTKIRELVLGDQNRYVAPELSLIAEHFFKGRIVDWAFAEKPDPTIYAVTGDGLVVSVTYDREQRVIGFARHDFGGIVESVAVIPGTEAGYDDLYMIVRRTIGGATVRYVEVLERPFDGDTDEIEDAFFVDCGLTYEGVAATTITGLNHLEGKEVVALADGSVVEGLTVSSGSITLSTAAEKVHVGLAYTSRAVTLPVFGPATDGTLFGRRKNVVSGFVDVLHTGALKVGAYGSDDWTPELYEQILKDGGGLFGNPITLRTGFQRCEIEGSWADGEGKVVMESATPLPALIRSFVFQLENEP